MDRGGCASQGGSVSFLRVPLPPARGELLPAPPPSPVGSAISSGSPVGRLWDPWWSGVIKNDNLFCVFLSVTVISRASKSPALA